MVAVGKTVGLFHPREENEQGERMELGEARGDFVALGCGGQRCDMGW